MSDRTVHATYRGMEIVRYNRAGKWYLEPTTASLPRQHVTISKAVDAALWGSANAPPAVWFQGRPGGSRFDALYRERKWLKPSAPKPNERKGDG